MATGILLIIGVIAGVLVGVIIGRKQIRTTEAADVPPTKQPEVHAAMPPTSSFPAPNASILAMSRAARRSAARQSIRITLGDTPVGLLTSFKNDRALQPVADERVRRGVESLLRATPAMALSGGLGSGKLVLLKLSPEAASRVASGDLTYMAARTGGLRANLIDGGGTIRNQASFVDPAVAGQAAGAALAVWQVLAIVTAQKFLADIDRKLAAIERGVGDLREFLEQEQLGRLNGNLSYMKRVASELAASDISETDLQAYVAQLESIDREAHQLEGAIGAEMQRQESALETMTLTGQGFGEHVEAAHGAVSGYGRAAQVLLLLNFMRCVAAQLRAALPVSKSATLKRVRSVADAVAAAADSHARFLGSLERRIPDLRGEFTYDSTDEREQAKLKVRYFELKERLNGGSRLLGSAAKRLERDLLAQIEGRRGVKFVASLDEQGNVRELSAAGPRQLRPKN